MLRKKYFKIGPYGLVALVLIVLASVLRVLILAGGWPWMNSDEATMGLMARHIAYQGELPIFYYGQAYMGAIEAYIGALFFHLFGPSRFTLRFGMVLLYAAFLGTMYVLTGRLYSKKLALVTLFLLCFGSIEMYTRQLRAVGGDMETMLFGALTMLFTALLILSVERATVATERKRRYALYACLGLAMGLGIWSHMLILPFVAVAVIFLWLFCRHELRGPAIFLLVGGLIIGMLPLLIFNVKYPAQNSLATLWELHSSGGVGAALSYGLRDEISGTVLVSLPMTTGAYPLCSLSDVPGAWRTQISSCLLFQGSWGAGFLLLLALAIVLAVIALNSDLRGHWRALVNMNHTARTGDEAVVERENVRLQALRLMLLLSAVLTLASYTFSEASALVPITSTRYLVGVLVALPAILAPLWYGARALLRNTDNGGFVWKNGPGRERGEPGRGYGEPGRPQGYAPTIHGPVQHAKREYSRGVPLRSPWLPISSPWPPTLSPWLPRFAQKYDVLPAIVRGCILLFISAILVNGTVGVFHDVAHVSAMNQQEGKLANDLLEHHVTRMYTDYWTCNLVAFVSNEQIICSVVVAGNGKLVAGQNRYPPYVTEVQQDAQAAYVLPVGSPEAATFAQQIAQSGAHYQRSTFDGYIVYQPV